MTGTSKQTALFFGFLAAAMTHASAQAAPAASVQAQAGPNTVAVERLIAESGATSRPSDASIAAARQGRKAAG